eukprot:jgi/Mesvir1/13015/Mv06015-RA.1
MGTETVNVKPCDENIKPGAPPTHWLLQKFLTTTLKLYFDKNPTAKAVYSAVAQREGVSRLASDHFAFRTFGVDGFGIDSMESFLLTLGYRRQDRLLFEKKHLKAYWYKPPAYELEHALAGGDKEAEDRLAFLPRIFVSELQVDELSPGVQRIIGDYTSEAATLARFAPAACAMGALPWQRPSYKDFCLLAKESEYAAWTLVNGYSLNHTTLAVHQLRTFEDLEDMNEFVEEKGWDLNTEGGVLKVSPDGGLRQSSTVADTQEFIFDEGPMRVPASYIEFAQRLVLPAHAHLPPDQVREEHRRDGFEVSNADGIFESTSSKQLGIQYK